MKKILMMIFICINIIIINGCTNLLQKVPLKTVEKKVIQTYEAAYPGEQFYFLSGPFYDSEKRRTNIRYRGLISTKKLEDMGYYKGISIEMENPNSDVWVRDYADTLEYLEMYLPLKNEAKKVFGDNMIFEINGTYTDSMDENIKKRMGTNMPRDKKIGLGVIVLTVFADDLDKDVMGKQNEWKEKMLAIGKRYWEYYNITASIQLSIFDRKLLYSHDLAWASIGGIKNTDTKLKGYLKRIRLGERLKIEEEAYVLERMGSNNIFVHLSNINFDYENLRSFDLGTDRMKKEEELKLDSIKLETYEAYWKNRRK